MAELHSSTAITTPALLELDTMSRSDELLALVCHTLGIVHLITSNRRQNSRAMASLNTFIEAHVAQLQDSVDQPTIAANEFAAWLARHPPQTSPSEFKPAFNILWVYRCTGLSRPETEARNAALVSVFNLMLAVDLKYHPRVGDPPTIPHYFNGVLVTGKHEAECVCSRTFYDAVCHQMNDDPEFIKCYFGTAAFDAWDALFNRLRGSPQGLFAGLNGLVGENQQPWTLKYRVTGMPAQFKETLPSPRRLNEHVKLYPTSYENEHKASYFLHGRRCQGFGSSFTPFPACFSRTEL